ncbi:MAG: hypothetical protein KY443_07510, partial [Actinobacteria bacterium]|nr:hypothetical protein [Actinomycetota bacterium]
MSMTDSQWVDPVLQVADAMSRVPDEAMEGFVTWVGVDAVLDGVFAEICRRFEAEKAGSNTAVVQWEIATADGPVIFQLHISDGTCRAVRGADELPQLTIGLHLTDFLRSLVGQLDTTE